MLVVHSPISSSSSSMRDSAASFMLIGLSPADSETRRRKVKADLASHTAPKRVATQLIASVPLKSMSCWSVMRLLRSEPSWIAVMRTNSSSMFTIARLSPWHMSRIELRSMMGRGASCMRSIQCCTLSSRFSRSTGKVRKSSIPASRQAGMPVPRFCALMPMMGSRLWSIMPWPLCSKARIRSAASMPDMPGMLMSMSTRSYSVEKPSMIRTASRPLLATSHSIPAASRIHRTSFWLTGWSSAISTRRSESTLGGWWQKRSSDEAPCRTTGDGESFGSSLIASVRHLKRRCDETGLVSTCHMPCSSPCASGPLLVSSSLRRLCCCLKGDMTTTLTPIRPPSRFISRTWLNSESAWLYPSACLACELPLKPALKPVLCAGLWMPDMVLVCRLMRTTV
mmetsp:Transcript_10499/g.26177  ORF Transcript_10499/g.26177 Transcript_10499/m.26177 type:complete len:396 (-) Transcript_10499:1007-2194(-)